MRGLYFFGRILIGSFLIFGGYNCFRHPKKFVKTISSRGLRMPYVLLFLSGIDLFVSGGMFFIGYYTPVASWLAVLFLVVASFTMHDYWKDKDFTNQLHQKIQFFKNIAIAGALLFVYGLQII